MDILGHKSHLACYSEPVLTYIVLLTIAGSIEPCVAPCTDYGIVITPRGNSSRLKISAYEFNLQKGKVLRRSDVKKLSLFPDHVPLDLKALFKRTSSVGEIMMPLIKAAKDAIPPDFHTTTTILFSLDEISMSLNEDVWFRVLGEVQQFFANKTVPFLTGAYFVRDSDDYKDAAYRWLTMNFVRGLFEDNTKPTVATLSFNGIMQCEIAYEKMDVDNSILFLSEVAGTPHPIVTSTFFRLGSLTPLYKYFEKITNGTQSAVVSSPCGPKGLKKKYRGDNPKVKWIVGAGQIEGCRNVIRDNIFKLSNKMNGYAYLKHKVKGKIYGMPNVVATMQKLGYKECTKDFTPQMLDKAVRRMCSGTGSSTKINASNKMENKQVSAKNGARVPLTNQASPAKNDEDEDQSDHRSESGIIDCVYGNFLYLMLSEGYYLAPDTNIHVNFDVPKNLALDPSLGELLYRMQLLN